MHKSFLIPLLFPLFLIGCTPPPTSDNGNQGTTLETSLTNPLYAERYYEALVDRMVEFEIDNDPILEDPAKKKLADETRRGALAAAREARKEQREGTHGFFIKIKEYAYGETLYLNNTLYLSTTFETEPGPSLHIFLTTVVDPRDVDFPDDTAIDLGRLESPYGAQQYTVPTQENPNLYRTAVLWDTELERLYGFAQLSV